MARKQIWLRKRDGSGAGVMFRTQGEVDTFLKANPGYAVESEQETAVNQEAADNAVAAKAAEQAEDKAVAGPRRNR